MTADGFGRQKNLTERSVVGAKYQKHSWQKRQHFVFQTKVNQPKTLLHMGPISNLSPLVCLWRKACSCERHRHKLKYPPKTTFYSYLSRKLISVLKARSGQTTVLSIIHFLVVPMGTMWGGSIKGTLPLPAACRESRCTIGVYQLLRGDTIHFCEKCSCGRR